MIEKPGQRRAKRLDVAVGPAKPPTAVGVALKAAASTEADDRAT